MIELANYGIMLWGNVNGNACEAIMGYNESGKSNLSGASYKIKGWNNPHLIAYMESHDEERMMYKAQKYGNVNGTYDIKNLPIALQRAGLCATVFFAIPGPKMIWQFGELGYDYSINACPTGSENESCRTSNKAIRWDYLQDNYRKNLYWHYAEILQLRQLYDVFHTDDFSTSLNGEVKNIVLRSPQMNMVVVGNFGITAKEATLPLPTQGIWYEYFSQTSSQSADLQTVTLNAGEYRIYTDVKITRLDLPTAAPLVPNEPVAQLRVSPNPVSNVLNVMGTNGNELCRLYNSVGQLLIETKQTSINVSGLPSGIYFLQVGKSTVKVVKQ
ncbi:hypothetical protein AGMMS4956_05510 [Bacteroidia bacterium]|nr:hypothetical protein AGMMS4956_05510 [Bacteroidia bacterium]